ncbi:MAG: sterol desaturase family protein [Myxococcota bacterium]
MHPPQGVSSWIHRWVHPGLLLLVATAMSLVPAEHAGTAFLVSALFMITTLGVLEAVAPYEARSQTHRGELVGIVGFGVAAYVAGKLAEPVSAWLVARLPIEGTLRDAPLFFELLVGILAVELCFYLWHRAGHEIGFLWRLHRVHHVPTKVNLGTYFVFHPLDAFMFGAVRFVPLLALGVSERAFFLIATVGFAHKLLCHSNVGGPLGRLSFIVGTAENHRIHHSRAPSEAGNYGFVLPIWDHVFGTFVHLKGDTPRAYGVFSGDTGPKWLDRVLGAKPPRSRRLRQRADRMEDLDETERRALVAVREKRLHRQDDEATKEERERVLADLAHYTHVTRGFDRDGTVRYFLAFRLEPSADRKTVSILLGPHFKERGVHVAAPVAQLAWHLTRAFLRRPSAKIIFGSSVSLSGYAFIAQRLRGYLPIWMPGDPNLEPEIQAMLDRLSETTDQRIQWEHQRGLIRYPVGVHLSKAEAQRLNLTERERTRYLERCPDVFGPDSRLVVPIAFTGGLPQMIRFLIRIGELLIQRLF